MCKRINLLKNGITLNIVPLLRFLEVILYMKSNEKIAAGGDEQKKNKKRPDATIAPPTVSPNTRSSVPLLLLAGVLMLGSAVGAVGAWLGRADGFTVTTNVGSAVGALVTTREGFALGARVG